MQVLPSVSVASSQTAAVGGASSAISAATTVAANLASIVTAATPTLALVSILAKAADGRFSVSIDGKEAVATSTENLTPGSRYLLQVQSTPAGLVLRAPPQAATPTLALVSILAKAADGRFTVSIDGKEAVATSTENLTPGSRYLLQVQSTPAGLVLRAPPQAATPTLALVSILSNAGDGRFTVSIDGKEAVATSTENLTPGSRYLLQVQSTPAGLVLRAPPQAATPTLALVSILSNAGDGRFKVSIDGKVAVATSTENLTPGARYVLQVQNTPTGLVLRAPAETATPTAVVSIVANIGDGRFKVSIDGKEEIATSTENLTPGSRYVLQVERTPTGLVLRPPADGGKLTEAIANTVLLASLPADLGSAVGKLLDELNALQNAEPTESQSTPGALKQAAVATREAVRAFLPENGQPLDGKQMQALVEDGGMHYEAKLARLATQDQDSTTLDRGQTRTQTPTDKSDAARPDLKQSLLQLLNAAKELGGSATLPAARVALDGIESQQAANVTAQSQGSPYVIQIPFPDGGQWKTLNLAIESERQARSGEQSSGSFRMLMHVPLNELGETWIDASLSGNRFRAVLYFENSQAQERVRAELPDLAKDLRGSGFSEVLLDVRSADSLPSRQRQQAVAMRAGRANSDSLLDVRA